MTTEDYIASVPNIPEWLLTFSELLTVAVSMCGIIACLHHAVFFKPSASGLASRLRNVFLTDAGVYLVTLVMGIGLYYNWALLVKYDVVIRPFVLIANVVASVSLYAHYRRVK